MRAFKFTSRLVPWGFTRVNAFYCARETGLHVNSSVLQCKVLQHSQSQWEEQRGSRHPIYSSFHSSKQMQVTAAQFFTLFSHSTRSTSGKCTYDGENRGDNHYVGFNNCNHASATYCLIYVVRFFFPH